MTVKDLNSGDICEDCIVISKEQLKAAQIVCQSSKELIHRLYEHRGLKVLNIGKAEKRTINVDMTMLWKYMESGTNE